MNKSRLFLNVENKSRRLSVTFWFSLLQRTDRKIYRQTVTPWSVIHTECVPARVSQAWVCLCPWHPVHSPWSKLNSSRLRGGFKPYTPPCSPDQRRSGERTPTPHRLWRWEDTQYKGTRTVQEPRPLDLSPLRWTRLPQRRRCKEKDEITEISPWQPWAGVLSMQPPDPHHYPLE